MRLYPPMRQSRQTALFEPRVDENRPGLVHRDAPDTERAAAAAVLPRSGTQRARVYELLRAASERGMTDWELVDSLGMLRSSVCARRNELIREGWVIDSGRRRRERTGSHAIVWVTTHREV